MSGLVCCIVNGHVLTIRPIHRFQLQSVSEATHAENWKSSAIWEYWQGNTNMNLYSGILVVMLCCCWYFDSGMSSVVQTEISLLQAPRQCGVVCCELKWPWLLTNCYSRIWSMSNVSSVDVASSSQCASITRRLDRRRLSIKRHTHALIVDTRTLSRLHMTGARHASWASGSSMDDCSNTLTMWGILVPVSRQIVSCWQCVRRDR